MFFKSIITDNQSKRFGKIYILNCLESRLHVYNDCAAYLARRHGNAPEHHARSGQFTDLQGVHIFVYLCHHKCEVTASVVENRLLNALYFYHRGF